MNYINELRFKLEILWIDHSRKICFLTGLIIGSWLL
jgi:hypothetical protein